MISHNIKGIYTVVAVDDDPKVLNLIRQALSGGSMRILTAESTVLGRAILQRDNVDMVISDYIMPGGMSGLDFLEEVKNTYPEVLRVLQSGNANLAMAIKAINNAGVCKLIEKPWDPFKFKETISNALESRRVVRNHDIPNNLSHPFEVELCHLEQQYPGITSVERDTEGYIVLPDPEYDQE